MGWGRGEGRGVEGRGREGGRQAVTERSDVTACNVYTRYLPEKFDEKLKLVNTEVNTQRVFTWRFLRYP